MGGEDSKSQGLVMLPLSPLQTQFPCLYLEEVVPNPSYIPLSPISQAPTLRRTLVRGLYTTPHFNLAAYRCLWPGLG